MTPKTIFNRAVCARAPLSYFITILLASINKKDAILQSILELEVTAVFFKLSC